MATNTNIDFNRNHKVGEFFYRRHRNDYGVWVWENVSADFACGRFIADFSSREEARTYVWKMNGWGTPKTTLS